jgi:hypothetical protein
MIYINLESTQATSSLQWISLFKAYGINTINPIQADKELDVVIDLSVTKNTHSLRRWLFVESKHSCAKLTEHAAEYEALIVITKSLYDELIAVTDRKFKVINMKLSIKTNKKLFEPTLWWSGNQHAVMFHRNQESTDKVVESWIRVGGINLVVINDLDLKLKKVTSDKIVYTNKYDQKMLTSAHAHIAVQLSDNYPALLAASIGTRLLMNEQNRLALELVVLPENKNNRQVKNPTSPGESTVNVYTGWKCATDPESLDAAISNILNNVAVHVGGDRLFELNAARSKKTVDMLKDLELTIRAGPIATDYQN